MRMLPDRPGRAIRRTILFFPILLGACATEFVVSQAPSTPFSSFGQAKVAPVSIELSPDTDQGVLKEARRSAEIVVGRLSGRLEGSRLFASSGRAIEIRCRIVKFDPGSQSTRYIVGMGAGTGHMKVEFSLVDEAGAIVASGSVKKAISGGFFGGNFDDVPYDIADSIFQFIKDNHKQVVPEPER
jgi:hypothetical protein